MRMVRPRPMIWVIGLGLVCAGAPLTGQGPVVTATLTYGAPGHGPSVGFSPYGTQVALEDVGASVALPEGAVRPAKLRTLHIGPTQASWMTILVTADPAHPSDLCRVYLDRNRNGTFDDGDPLVATPSQNEKTKAWWSSFAKTELQVPYAKGSSE